MHLSALDLSIFLVYVLVVLAVGVYAARKTVDTKRDYFLAGDKLPWWVVGGSIVASNLSSHQFVGMTGAAYGRGFVAICAEWGAIFGGLSALLWIFLPFYLRNGFYTLPEYLQQRFGATARLTYGGLLILIYIFVEIASVLYLGALAVHSLFGIEMLTSIVVLAALTSLYTITGGLRAVVWTEMLQLCVLLIGGTILSIATIRASGGWSALIATSKEWHLILPANDPDYPWTQYLGANASVGVFYWATNQFIVQRALAARSTNDARLGVVMAMFVKFALPLITVVPGLLAAKLFPGLSKADLAFPTLVENLLPTGLVGLVMAGLIAAIMSHVSGAINSCTTIASIDFYLPYVRKNATDLQTVRFGKIVGIIVVLLGIVCAWALIKHSEKPVFLYLMSAYGYFAPGIAAMFFLGIFWRRGTHAGALAAGALTVPLSAILDVVYPIPFANRTGIVFVACIVLAVVVSLFTTPKPAAEIENLVWNWKSATGTARGEEKPKILNNFAVWWCVIIALVAYFYYKYW